MRFGLKTLRAKPIITVSALFGVSSADNSTEEDNNVGGAAIPDFYAKGEQFQQIYTRRAPHHASVYFHKAPRTCSHCADAAVQSLVHILQRIR